MFVALREKCILYLISIINVISIFFGYAISNLFYLQIFEIGILIIFIKWSRIKVYPDSKVWFLFLAYIVVTSFFSIDMFASFRFILMLFLAYVNKLLLDSFDDWKRPVLNLMYYASMIHVIATVMQFLFPHVIEVINSFILSGDNLLANQELTNYGGYAGITGQTGVNAFYISIFIMLSFIKISYEDKKVRKLLLMFLGVIALFLTSKRSFLLFVIILIPMYYIFRQSGPIYKKMFKLIFISIIILLLALFLNKLGVMDSILNKNDNLSAYGDLTNGRNLLWKKTFMLFLSHPFFGYGIDTIHLIIGQYTHNIYIQTLCEIGIFGCVIFIFAIIISLLNVIRSLKVKSMYKDISLLIQLLFLFYGFTGNPLYGHIFLMTYFLSMSLGKESKGEKKDERKRENEGCNINLSYIS